MDSEPGLKMGPDWRRVVLAVGAVTLGILVANHSENDKADSCSVKLSNPITVAVCPAVDTYNFIEDKSADLFDVNLP